MRSLRALARDLGLSPATVSRALSGHPHVHRTVRAQVLAAAAAAGLATPTAGAAAGRRLLTVVGRSWARGGLAGPYTALLAGAAQGARQAGAHLASVVLDRLPADGLDQDPACAGLRPSAALLLYWTDADAIAAIAARLPCVLVGQTPAEAEGSGVRLATFDAADGVLRLLDHLLELGHRRIASLADAALGWRSIERHGAAHAAALLRRHPLRHLLVEGGDGWDGVRRAHRAGVTAWIADGQNTAYALIDHLAGWGAQVPRDVSVCSFHFTPPEPGQRQLTGMRGDWQAVGRIAARWALTRPDPTDPVTRLLVRSRVEPGDTTAPPR
jgi:LacI family transcriptional regulator